MSLTLSNLVEAAAGHEAGWSNTTMKALTAICGIQLRQGTHLSKDGTHFKGTDNDRTRIMLKEADECAVRLRSFKKKLVLQHEATASECSSIYLFITLMHSNTALLQVTLFKYRSFVADLVYVHHSAVLCKLCSGCCVSVCGGHNGQ